MPSPAAFPGHQACGLLRNLCRDHAGTLVAQANSGGFGIISSMEHMIPGQSGTEFDKMGSRFAVGALEVRISSPLGLPLPLLLEASGGLGDANKASRLASAVPDAGRRGNQEPGACLRPVPRHPAAEPE